MKNDVTLVSKKIKEGKSNHSNDNNITIILSLMLCIKLFIE